MKVTIYGYNESFALTPAVKVYQNDRLITKVPAKGIVELDGIEMNSILEFKCMTRSASCVVSNSKIVLSFNRFTGGLNAVSTEHVEIEMCRNSTKDSSNILLAMFFAIILILLGMFMLIKG